MKLTIFQLTQRFFVANALVFTCNGLSSLSDKARDPSRGALIRAESLKNVTRTAGSNDPVPVFETISIDTHRASESNVPAAANRTLDRRLLRNSCNRAIIGEYWCYRSPQIRRRRVNNVFPRCVPSTGSIGVPEPIANPIIGETVPGDVTSILRQPFRLLSIG